MVDVTIDPGLSVSFVVQTDDFILGNFTACDGLGAEFVMEQREEGGNHLFIHQLPMRLKYPNVKLTRVVRQSNPSIAAWFTKQAALGAPPSTMAIHCWDLGRNEHIVSWYLGGVVPVKWTGPQFNVETNKPLTESLEVAHTGFTNLGGG